LEDQNVKTEVVYEKAVYGKQRSADQSVEDILIYESENSPQPSKDFQEGNTPNREEEAERLMRRAERIHRNFVDIIGNEDHLLDVDAKIEQARTAVESLTEIDRQLSANQDGKNTESEKVRLKSKLLRLLEDLESTL